MGILNDLNPFESSDDTPKPGVSGLDSDTQNLIHESYQRALQDPNQMGGVAQASQLPSNEQLDQREQRMGGLMDPNMSKAIRSKYSKSYGDKLQSLESTAGRDVFKKRAQKLKFAQQALAAQQQVENENYKRLIDAHNNEQEMRAQTLRTWMNVGGMAAGMVLGGAPGAMAGSKVGDAAVAKKNEITPIGGSDSVSYGRQNMGSRYGGMTEPLGDY